VCNSFDFKLNIKIFFFQNFEFQWYTNNRTNSYVENGVLNIHPSLTSDELGESFLSSGTLSLHGSDPATQ
jgi:transcription initiation factor IIF auxiliary subunit